MNEEEIAMNDEEFACVKDLVTGVKIPVAGNRHSRISDGPLKICNILVTDKQHKLLDRYSFGQPFELYYNYDVIRELMKKRMAKKGIGCQVGPNYLSVIHEYIRFDGGGHQVPLEKTKGKIFWNLSVDTLSNFEVMKLMNEVAKEKRDKTFGQFYITL